MGAVMSSCSTISDVCSVIDPVDVFRKGLIVFGLFLITFGLLYVGKYQRSSRAIGVWAVFSVSTLFLLRLLTWHAQVDLYPRNNRITVTHGFYPVATSYTVPFQGVTVACQANSPEGTGDGFLLFSNDSSLTLQRGGFFADGAVRRKVDMVNAYLEANGRKGSCATSMP